MSKISLVSLSGLILFVRILRVCVITVDGEDIEERMDTMVVLSTIKPKMQRSLDYGCINESSF